jgi:hypothetical protein
MQQKYKYIPLLVLALLSGCATQQHKKTMISFDDEYSQGHYLNAALSAEANIKIKEGMNYDTKGLLAHLEAAEGFRLAGDLYNSTKHYDAVESAVKDWELRSLGEKVIIDGVVSIISNDSVKRFQPQSREGILANTYKAINYMSEGDMASARVEFNRAQDRMARAVQISAKQITKRKKAKQKKAKNISDTNNTILKKFPELDIWEVYPDFVNPFTVYLHAIYLLTTGQDAADFEKGLNMLERVVGMNSSNSELEDQLHYFNDIATTSILDRKKYVWIMHETGLSPILYEKSFDIPVPVDHSTVILPFAFPAVKLRRPDWPTITVGYSETEKRTSQIASMDRIVQTDFKRKFPRIVTKSITSAVVKGAAQAAATKKFGSWGDILGKVLAKNSTKADLRIWRAMPSSWGITRVERPQNGMITLKTPNGMIIDNIHTPDVKNSMIYIKTPTAIARPYISIISLGYGTP